MDMSVGSRDGALLPLELADLHPRAAPEETVQKTQAQRDQQMTIIRDWCRFDHRLTLMLLASCIQEVDDKGISEMMMFAAEWRVATKESQVDLFNDVMKNHNM